MYEHREIQKDGHRSEGITEKFSGNNSKKWCKGITLQAVHHIKVRFIDSTSDNNKLSNHTISACAPASIFQS